MDLDVEEKRVAIEAIATLAHIKSNLATLILEPAGFPASTYRHLLYKCDPATGRKLSKRQIAPLIIEAAEQSGRAQSVRKIVELAARWDKFHLADDEYAARATVAKALEVCERAGRAEREASEACRQADVEARVQDARDHARQLELLLTMFDDLSRCDDHQRRGYLLQDLLTRLFTLSDIPVLKSFLRNEGAEQVDGAFRLGDWHYLVECRWRRKLADIRELDGLKGQVDRSGKQTMGLFLSIEGWSNNVVPLLKQNPEKSIVLMEGYDLRTTLTGQISLMDLLKAKISKLNLEAEPYYSARDCLSESS